MSDNPQPNPDSGTHDTTRYSAPKAPDTRLALESKEGGVVPGAPAESSE